MPAATRDFAALLDAALHRRAALLENDTLTALRLFHSSADGVPGLFIDRLGPGLTLIRHLGKTPDRLPSPSALAATLLRTLAPRGVRAVYDKPFAQDRSRLGGATEAVLTDPTPLAGDPLPESILVREGPIALEARLYDGFSTGIFLDQRANRAALGRLCSDRPGARVLNTFSYTCSFSVACALAGAPTTSVDVSPRYLDWGRRNFTHNGLDPEAHRFVRMDTFEFLDYARRKRLLYDLIILDPPTFSAGNKRRGIPLWSAVRDYPRLVAEAAGLLDPAGARLLFASTNATELCRHGRLRALVAESLGVRPRWIELPAREDVPGDEDAAACLLAQLP